MDFSRKVWARIAVALALATAWRDPANQENPKKSKHRARFLLLGLPALAVVLALTPVGRAIATGVAQFCTAPLPGTNSGCIAGVCGQTGSMEGALKVAPGDQLDAGYNFKVNNTSGAAITVIVSGRVVFPVLCPNNTTNYLVLPLDNIAGGLPSPTTGLPAGAVAFALSPITAYSGLNCDNTSSPDGLGDGECTYSVPTGSSQLPSGNQNSSLTYQSGVWQVPAGLCGGVAGNVNAGVVFSGTITDNDQKDNYVFQFHYGSTNKSGHGLLGTSVSGTFSPGKYVCKQFTVNKSCGTGTFNAAQTEVTYPVNGPITETSGSDSGFTITDNTPLDAGSLTCYIPGVGGNAALPCVDAPQPTTVSCSSVTLNASGPATVCYQATFTSSSLPPVTDVITATDTSGTSQPSNQATCVTPSLTPAISVTKACTAFLVPDPENDGQIVVEVTENGTITNTSKGQCSNNSSTSCLTNSDCSGGTCQNQPTLTSVTLTDNVPGQTPNRPITLSTTTLAPGAFETYTSSYFPEFLGTCSGATTPCTTNEQCGTGGTCVPAPLPDAVTVQAACADGFCTQPSVSANASCAAPICPTCPNCPFNLQ